MDAKAVANAAGVLLCAAALWVTAGCTTADSQPAAKAQYMTLEFDGCQVYVAGSLSFFTNGALAKADSGTLPTIELFTQTQSNETDGDETFAPQNTQSPTTDVKPDIDANYNGPSRQAAGLLESLTASGLKTLVSALQGKKTGKVSLETKDGQVTVDCADGRCMYNGQCVTCSDDGECTYCEL